MSNYIRGTYECGQEYRIVSKTIASSNLGLLKNSHSNCGHRQIDLIEDYTTNRLRVGKSGLSDQDNG